MARLNKEEKEILEAYESGKVKTVRGKKAALSKHQEYAEATFRKDKRVNIRISGRDLNLLQRRALSEGIHPLPSWLPVFASMSSTETNSARAGRYPVPSTTAAKSSRRPSTNTTPSS